MTTLEERFKYAQEWAVEMLNDGWHGRILPQSPYHVNPTLVLTKKRRIRKLTMPLTDEIKQLIGRS